MKKKKGRKRKNTGVNRLGARAHYHNNSRRLCRVRALVTRATRGVYYLITVGRSSTTRCARVSRERRRIEKNPLVTGTKGLLLFDDLSEKRIANVGSNSCKLFLIICRFNGLSPSQYQKCLLEQRIKSTNRLLPQQGHSLSHICKPFVADTSCQKLTKVLL